MAAVKSECSAETGKAKAQPSKAGDSRQRARQRVVVPLRPLHSAMMRPPLVNMPPRRIVMLWARRAGVEVELRAQQGHQRVGDGGVRKEVKCLGAELPGVVRLAVGAATGEEGLGQTGVHPQGFLSSLEEQGREPWTAQVAKMS